MKIDFRLKNKMKILTIFSSIFCLSLTFISIKGYENPYILGNEQIGGYHFHTYFFQNNAKSCLEAEILRYLLIDHYFVIATRSIKILNCSFK